MFQLLNVHALLAHDYQLSDTATGWRIARLDMVGGHEADSAAWTVTLAKGPARRLLTWPDFLRTARLPGVAAKPVGEQLAEVLAAVEKRLRDRQRRRDFGGSLRRGMPTSQAIELLLRGDDTIADWTQAGLSLDAGSTGNAAELLAGLDAHLAADREILRRRDLSDRPAVATIELAIAAAADANIAAARHNELSEQLDQGCAACRDLLTLSGSDPNPDRSAAVAQAILAGSVEAYLDELLRAQFPDLSFALAVHTGDAAREPLRAEGQPFHARIPLAVPLWSLAQKTELPLHIALVAEAPARLLRPPLEEMLAEIAHLLRDWSGRRERPIVSGGDGWLCLLDYMNWDSALFDRWLSAAPLYERVARFAYLGRPPQSRERLPGWRSLLASLVAERDQLRPADWMRLAPHLTLWDETDRVEFQSSLRKQAIGRLRAERATTAELGTWIEAWRRMGAPGRAVDLFEDLNLRARRTRDPADAGLATQFWRDAQRPAAWVPDLAGALDVCPACAAELAAELASALPEADVRRAASLAVSACVLAAGSADAKPALAPLAQREPDPAAWRVDEAWRGALETAFKQWTAALDRSQQRDEWQKLLAHRATLTATGLLRDA